MKKIATVIAIPSPGSYTMEDVVGRQFKHISSKNLSIGDVVLIVNGTVEGKVPTKEFKTYQV